MPDLPLVVPQWSRAVAGVLTVGVTVVTALHIILRKDDARAAAGWLAVVWFAPVLGVALYWVFGINRIRRRARLLRAGRKHPEVPEEAAAVPPPALAGVLAPERRHLVHLAQLTERLTRQPLVEGNRVTPLENGDEAYPAMLQAIRGAESSVALATYIFDNDPWGRKFRGALREARDRGVEVRILVDAVGARYSFPAVVRGLRRDGVSVARFMRSLPPWRFRYFNLRNHRKILVVDGTVGFTGGMNIRAGHVLFERPRRPVQDIHFRVEGPVVAELQRVFADDWAFTTGEALTGPAWFPHLEPVGAGAARGISDGPDEDFDKLRMIILGALACARNNVRIATPYFLPDPEIATSLRVAALRGVDTKILLPAKSNLPVIQWASTAGLAELLESGCRIFLTPPPFDHSKVFVVDGGWTLIGSANWDPRSLVLNFEFNVECYDPGLAEQMGRWFGRRLAAAAEVRFEDLASRSAAVRLRDRGLRLLSPYL